MNITGTLDNTGLVWLKGAGDKATITGLVTNELDAEIFLFGGSKATMNGGLNNAGTVDVEGGSTLQVNGDATNSGNLYTNQQGDGGMNTVNITGMLTNSGNIELFGPKDTATIGSLTNNAGGFVDVEGGSTLTITGDVTNNAGGPQGIYTSFNGTGSNTLNIGGTLTNNGMVGIESTGDALTVTGDVTNNSGAEIAFTGNSMGTFKSDLTNNVGATVDLENASTLTIMGNADNSGTLGTSLFNGTGGNSLSIDGALTNSGIFAITGHLDSAAAGSITNNSGGLVDLERGSSLSVTGNVINSGEFDTSDLGQGGGNVVIVNGSFTNNSGGLLQLLALNDQVTVGSLTNNAGGFVDVENGATLTVNGDVTNSSGGGGKNGIFTTYNTISGDGGATIDITGTLTNSGTFQLNGPGDMATIGNGLANSGNFYIFNGSTATIGNGATNAAGGTIDLENGSTLMITGDVTNSGLMYTDQLGMGGGNKLNITGNLNNQFGGQFAALKPGDALSISGNVNNNGIFGLLFGDTATIGGAVNNSGGFDVDNGSMATIGGDLTNSGIVDVEGGSTLQINGALTNSGGVTTNNMGIGGGNTITVNGLLTNTASGLITLNGPGDVLNALAGLSNSGVINVNNGSSILPPFFNNLGTLNIDGTSRFVVGTPTPMGGQGYIQTPNGVLGEMIASMNSFGVINVNGSALLNGTLDVLLQGGYNPGVGSMYKFLNFTPGELSGMFANIPANGMFTSDGEQWMITYDNADGYVELTAEGRQVVSEPGTLLVLIPGLLGMGYGLRRRLLK